MQKENEILWNKVNFLTKGLADEQIKRSSLEQYGRREMIEISGIAQEANESCIDLAYKVCELVNVNIKKSKIEITHRIKNGDIIIKFKDRPSRDYLYANRTNLKDKSVKDIGFQNETSIYLNESLSFDTKGLLYEVRRKCKALGYKKIKWVKVSNYGDLESLK